MATKMWPRESAAEADRGWPLLTILGRKKSAARTAAGGSAAHQRRAASDRRRRWRQQKAPHAGGGGWHQRLRFQLPIVATAARARLRMEPFSGMKPSTSARNWVESLSR